MKILLIKPDGWPRSLADCPPGHFVYEQQLCFKTEYSGDSVFCESGEYFRPKPVDPIVQPVIAVWENVEP